MFVVSNTALYQVVSHYLAMTMNGVIRISRMTYQLLKHQHIISLLTVFGSYYNNGKRFASGYITAWTFRQWAVWHRISDALVNIRFCIFQHANWVIILF